MTRTVETMTAREFERMRALTAIETYPDGSEIYYCSRCSFQHKPLARGNERGALLGPLGSTAQPRDGGSEPPAVSTSPTRRDALGGRLREAERR